MSMSKPVKVLLGIATAWPLVYVGLFMFAIFGMMILEFYAPTVSSDEMPIWFFVLFAGYFLTFIWMMGLIVIYILHLFKTDRVPKDQKALWAVVIFLGNMLAMPVYWYLYIWREPALRVEG
jgi:hypothetical protein